MQDRSLWVMIIHAVVLAFAALTSFAYLTLMERKVLARLQHRVGPNQAGPNGYLQPLADAVKLMFKEDIMPSTADKWVFTIAPILATIPAIVIFAVIPLGPDLVVFGERIPLAFASLNIGLLYFLAVTSIGVYGITLAGWASNNKYSMLGGVRSAAQMISYELAFGLSVLVPVMLTASRSADGFGSLDLVQMVNAQAGTWFGFIPKWFVFTPTGFVAFFLFLIAATAEVTRAPFDLVEAEQELVGGYATEYSSMKFALFFMAEYMKLIAMSGFAATMFLGGWRFPYLEDIAGNWGALVGFVVIAAKIFFFLFLSIWVRASLPRIRYDKLMDFGWKRLLPVSLATVVATAVIVVLTNPL
ncbi:NADH-quinone oxidoreductase subunit NuoH [Herpetosiphon sp. NSE202]|uniref:NADH-quinone oxidoreductase subunit NuoH n=1 Tax=Herpetosiphon sp. NSE202 TaxID=3351349 RepID=UPI00363FA9A0